MRGAVAARTCPGAVRRKGVIRGVDPGHARRAARQGAEDYYRAVLADGPVPCSQARRVRRLRTVTAIALGDGDERAAS
jgi:hypothetical protein